MRFTTRLTALFALVLAAFVISTLPVTAGLFRDALHTPARASSWDDVAARWDALDPATREKAADLMQAVTAWKAASAVTALDSDARYLRFQTGFLMFSAFQALVLLVLVIVGLRLLMAPVRGMARVVDRLRSGDSLARLDASGGTEWKALAHQFNTMLDRNQTLSRLQGWQEVAAFLSHQIKNPLTSIAFAEQNVRSLAPDLAPLALQNLDIIADQGRRINNLVRRLRDLTSFEQMQRTAVPFHEWMATWVASRRREAEVWDVQLAPVGEVALVVLLWEQALDNLLANSREAWNGAEPLALRLTVTAGDEGITLSWSDSNVLAADTPVALVGTARYTTKKDGSGLGVFFIRRIAELHGGSLTVAASPSGGLLFTLTLEGGGRGPHSRRR